MRGSRLCTEPLRRPPRQHRRFRRLGRPFAFVGQLGHKLCVPELRRYHAVLVFEQRRQVDGVGEVFLGQAVVAHGTAGPGRAGVCHVNGGITVRDGGSLEAEGFVEQIREPLGVGAVELAGGIKYFQTAVSFYCEAIFLAGKVGGGGRKRCLERLERGFKRAVRSPEEPGVSRVLGGFGATDPGVDDLQRFCRGAGVFTGMVDGRWRCVCQGLLGNIRQRLGHQLLVGRCETGAGWGEIGGADGECHLIGP